MEIGVSRVDKHKAMRFPGKSPPMTAAERQRECRARKRGERIYAYTLEEARAAGLLPSPNPNPALPAPQKQPALPALPAPPTTAIQKSLPSDSSRSLALFPEGEESSGDGPRFCLPPAVAARLRSLLDKHKAGKHLTAAERGEAEGLLDIAEYFVVQRMRRQLAA